jgi:dephospho-CoA kinase
VRRALLGRWGERIVGANGEISRARIGEIVFADRRELEWLEALLHPRVVREYLRWREQVDAPLTATEVPLLYETGGDARFDAVVVITAPRDLRESRARVPTTGRAERLIPDEEKVRRADFAYVNDGSVADLDAFVARVVRRLEART